MKFSASPQNRTAILRYDHTEASCLSAHMFGDEDEADGTGRVLGCLVKGFGDNSSYMLGTVEELVYVFCFMNACLKGG